MRGFVLLALACFSNKVDTKNSLGKLVSMQSLLSFNPKLIKSNEDYSLALKECLLKLYLFDGIGIYPTIAISYYLI